MTWSTRELLLTKGVPANAVRWRRMRKERGLRLCEAAALIGVATNSLGRVELGIWEPTEQSSVLQKLRAFYGVER